MAAATLLKKISPSTVTGAEGTSVNPDMPQPIKGERVLYDLIGIAVKTRTGRTDKGDWCSFIGQFEATTPEGVVYAAPRCFIPQPFEDMLFSQLQTAQEADPKATVRFAVRVSVVPPTKGKPSAVGYEYRVMPLIESSDNNPLAQLRAEVAKVPQLQGPKVANLKK